MERRQVERRSRQSGSAKCAGCGHVNEPGMKFCGMCGTRVDRRMDERRGCVGRIARGRHRQCTIAFSGSTRRRATTQVAAPLWKSPMKRLSRFLAGASQQSFATILRAMKRCAPKQCPAKPCAMSQEMAVASAVLPFSALNSQPETTATLNICWRTSLPAAVCASCSCW